MSRADRRRAAKAAVKGEQPFQLNPDQKITLYNPVRDHFLEFIYANAVLCQRRPRHLTERGEKCDDEACSVVVEEGVGIGKTLVLCGAGPSLADNIADYGHRPGIDLWGCNSAAIWLYDNGYPVTHGFTVDQTAHMLKEWETTPDIEYLLASSCHTHLGELLTQRGRRTRFFHNFCGVPGPPVSYEVCKDCGAIVGEAPPSDCLHVNREAGLAAFEDWVYMALYPTTVRAGSGLNSVNRAIDVALYMGYDEIHVLGADCAMRSKSRMPTDCQPGTEKWRDWLRKDVVMHADGSDPLRSGASEMVLEGEIDGRFWASKPDMLVSAVWLVQAAHLYPQLHLVGDTLPVALLDKDDAFLKRLPTLVSSEGKDLTMKSMHADVILAESRAATTRLPKMPVP